MYQNRPRRFRRHSNGRNLPRDNGGIARLRPNSFSNSQTRNHFRPPQSAEKLFEKYNTLAKEALTSGDKTLSENYFQHADHFMRIIADKNSIQTQTRVQVDVKQLAENNNDHPNKTTEEKTEEKKE